MILTLTSQVPDIIAKLAPNVEAALLDDGVHEVKSIVGELQVLAEQVSSSPPTLEIERVLLECHEAVKELKAARTPINFLLSQLYYKRGEPARALQWNEQARRELNGIHPPLAKAVLLSQQLGISVQQNNLPEAEELRKRIEGIDDLQEEELPLIEAPLREFKITLEYESGAWDEQFIEELMHPLPNFYQAFLLGRFHLQYRKENRALGEFKRALELFENNEEASRYRMFPFIIALHRARALYQQNLLQEAREIFQKYSILFQRLQMTNAQLRAEIGIANIERVCGDYEPSRNRFLKVLHEAQDRNLKKIAFHACVGLASLERKCKRLEAAREFLREAESFLNYKNRKHLCTLNIEFGELEYDAFDVAAAEIYFKKSENLLSAAHQEEALLLRATMAFHRARYYLRVGNIQAARELLSSHIEELMSMLANPGSEYFGEASPAYQAGKLLRFDAYCALKDGRPVSSLYSCQRARELNKTDDVRSLSKIVFWEGMAYATLGELERSVARIERVQELCEHLGIVHPVRQYLREAAALDDPEYISRLAFSVSYLFDGSEVYDRFQSFEPEFVLAVEPTFPVTGKKGRFQLSEEDRREILKAFANDYEQRLAQASHDKVLADFAALYRGKLESALAHVGQNEIYGRSSAFDDGLEEAGRRVWKLLVEKMY